MNDKPDITFFVPCYNESKNVTGTLRMIKTLMQGRPYSHEIMVVDDGSSDTTTETVQSYCRSNPEEPVETYRNPSNLGLGRNYFLCAKKSRGRYYMLINGDNATSINDFKVILDQLGRADMIVPYVANQDERPWIRNWISRGFTLVVSLVSGHRLKYYNGPVLHLRENVLRFQPKASGFAYQAEILCRALSAGCSYLEVPLYYVKKKGEHSSAFRLVNIASVLKSLARISLKAVKSKIPALKSQEQ